MIQEVNVKLTLYESTSRVYYQFTLRYDVVFNKCMYMQPMLG